MWYLNDFMGLFALRPRFPFETLILGSIQEIRDGAVEISLRISSPTLSQAMKTAKPD
ncbi:hypothetical protein N9990_00485 [bacterium]|nr:hypothetical protein [bacterium]